MLERGRALTPPPWRDRALLATAILTWCAAVMFAVSPLLAPFLLAGCLLIPLAWLWFERRPQPPFAADLPLILLAAFGGWLALSSLWSPDHVAGLAAATYYAVFALIAWRTLAVARELAPDTHRRIALAFVLAYLFTAWLTLHEQSTGLALRRFVTSYVPLIRTDSHYVTYDKGWIIHIEPFQANRNIAAMVFMLWPALLLSRSFVTQPWQHWLRLATVAALVAGVLLSEHESSKVAVAASGAVFLAMRYARAVTQRALMAGWIAATLLVVPLCLGVYALALYRLPLLQHSGQHRIVIWGNTAQHVLQRPIAGHGLAATRALDDVAPKDAAFAPGTQIGLGTNIHSHNVFLQVWHETGLIGAVLLLAAGLPVLGWIQRLPDRTVAHAAGAWAAAMVLAGLSWSLIAPWFMAAFAFTALWTHFAAGFAAAEADRRLPA